MQRTHEPIRNVHSVNQPIITATRPPPPRLPVSARPPQPQPTSRRIQPQQVQQPISGQNYFENDGSLFDGASSRGEGSIIGSGFRGAEYEVSWEEISIKLLKINYYESIKYLNNSQKMNVKRF